MGSLALVRRNVGVAPVQGQQASNSWLAESRTGMTSSSTGIASHLPSLLPWLLGSFFPFLYSLTSSVEHYFSRLALQTQARIFYPLRRVINISVYTTLRVFSLHSGDADHIVHLVSGFISQDTLVWHLEYGSHGSTDFEQLTAGIYVEVQRRNFDIWGTRRMEICRIQQLQKNPLRVESRKPLHKLLLIKKMTPLQLQSSRIDRLSHRSNL